MRKLRRLLLFLTLSVSINGEDLSPGETLQKSMSSEEFRAFGLNKLSPTELEALNRWLSSDRLRLIQALRAQMQERASDEFIESRIAGDFEGWSGDTIFKLDNGQVWQQDSSSVYVSVKVRPRVTIYRSNGRLVMQVDGVPRTVAVKRLK
jgi:hypothetical protein